MSIICDKSILETNATTFFNNLIDSMALQCPQVDTQNLEGLFVIAGRIEINTSGVLSWRGGAYTNINTNPTLVPGAAINFAGSPQHIEITPPTVFTSGKTVYPIYAGVTQNIAYTSTLYEFRPAAYTLSVEAGLQIYLSRVLPFTAQFYYYPSSSAFNVGAISPLANSLLSTSNTSMVFSSGKLTVTMPWNLLGAPVLTPMKKTSSGKVYTCSLDNLTANTFDVYFYDTVTGNAITPSATDAVGFYANFGPASEIIDFQTNGIATGQTFWFYGIYQSK
ncbi:MAG: hypothetical protein BGO70_18410 [Bacteroidetes bacterium 43-93]|nr:hypothetical protein [Bacteroidota bacterium]OJX01703.1 MAG: hypothetical protein BGO70_18410 [Bacteroidetes bacterium 43-93]